MAQSGWERQLELEMRAVGLPAPQPQFRFAPPRRWTFDFAWPDHKLALEVEGGVWLRGGGRHTRGLGYERDCEKYNEAGLRGWVLLRATTAMVKDGRALNLIERALKASGALEQPA